MYRTHAQTKDVVGKAGVPKKNDGFRISLDAALGIVIKPGRIYVEGLLCELEEKPGTPSTYFNQPYYPDPETQHFNEINSPPVVFESPLSPPEDMQVNIADGTYIIYIDAWQREINYLDDPLIQEVALGEADTTTRLQTVWQVKLLKVNTDQPSAVSCKTTFPEWTNLVKAPTGLLNAQTSKSLAINDPCSLKPSSGFRGLENQLYRVEIQKGKPSHSVIQMVARQRNVGNNHRKRERKQDQGNQRRERRCNELCRRTVGGNSSQRISPAQQTQSTTQDSRGRSVDARDLVQHIRKSIRRQGRIEAKTMGSTEWLRYYRRHNRHNRLGLTGRWNRNTILERHLSLRRLLADPCAHSDSRDRVATL